MALRKKSPGKNTGSKKSRAGKSSTKPGKKKHKLAQVHQKESSKKNNPRRAEQIIRPKLEEFERGELQNRSGNRVERFNQALNIGRREARLAGAPNVPPPEGRGAKKKRAA
jgi:hypothetical protein